MPEQQQANPTSGANPTPATSFAEVIQREEGQPVQQEPNNASAETHTDTATGDSGEVTSTEPESQQEEPSLTVASLAERLGMSADDLPGKFKVTIKVDGKEQEVTLAEAIKGHQFEADYRQKTAKHAEDRKAYEARVQAFTVEQQQTAEQLVALYSELRTDLLGSEPSKTMLDANHADYNPAEFQRLTLLQQDRVKKFNTAVNRLRGKQQEAQRKQAAEVQAFAQQQAQALRDSVPEWKDEAKYKAGLKEIVDWLKAEGVPDERIAMMADAKDAMIARKAMLYDKAQKALAATKVKPVPQFTQPGAARHSGSVDRRSMTAAVDRLKGDQSREARVAAFGKLLTVR